MINKDGGADEDIKCRINKARCAFNSLRPMWRSTALSLRSKIGLFNSNVKAVLLYGSETWRVTKTNTDKLQAFVKKCLRHILKIRWPDKISNKDLWRTLKQRPIETDVKARKWGWIGHTLRKEKENIARHALDWNPQGKRRVGRPRKTWRRTVEEEAKTAGLTWAQIKGAAQNRVRWKCVTADFFSPGAIKDR